MTASERIREARTAAEGLNESCGSCGADKRIAAPFVNRSAGRGNTMATMTSEKLMAALDGAECVVYDANGYLLAWFGGESTGIHIYGASGVEVDYYQMGALSSGRYTVKEVRESMNQHILGYDDEA